MSELMKFKGTITGVGNIQIENDFDKIQILNNYKIGKHYEIIIREKRKLNSLGLYWLICNGLAFQHGGTPEYFHHNFKLAFLPSIEVTNPFTKRKEKTVDSIAFSKMDEVEYKKFLSSVIDFLTSKGIDYADLIRHTENKIN